MQVDAVFTWVQPDDEDYKKLRNTYGKEFGAARRLPPSTKTGKDTELFFSVNLVLKNLPWIRNVFVVVHDKQTIPEFGSPKVQTVFHSQIFPQPFLQLPTFNSHAIESVLHRIPGLAEHFIYFNDDTYVLQPMRVDQWFDTKTRLPKVYLKGFTRRSSVRAPLPTQYALHYICMINNHALLDKMFGFRAVRMRPWHQPIALTQTLVKNVERFFEKKNRFRTIQEYVPLPLALLVGLEQKLAVPANEKWIPNKWITATDFANYSNLKTFTLLCINDLGDHVPLVLQEKIFEFLVSVSGSEPRT